MSVRIVRVHTVPIAVVLVEVSRAVPLVSDVQIYVDASVSTVHISVVVIVLGRVVVVVVGVVHDWIVETIFVHGFPEELEVVLWNNVIQTCTDLNLQSCARYTLPGKWAQCR